MLSGLDEQIDSMSDDIDRRMKVSERSAIADQSRTNLSFTAGSDTISGPVDEIFPQIDPRTIELLFISATFARYDDNDQVTVRMRKKDPSEVLVRVTSPDGAWSRSTFAALSEEIENGVPKWSRFRRLSWKALLGVMIYIVVFLGVALILSSYPAIRSWALLPSLAVGVSAQSLFYVDAVRDWFFPPFELREGRQSTGSRRLALVAGIVLSIPVGVLVNVISPS